MINRCHPPTIASGLLIAALAITVRPAALLAAEPWYEDPPDARATLGAPWDSTRRDVPFSGAACVAFTREAGALAYHFNKEEITSRHDLSRDLNVSASASVKALFGKGSVKAKFTYDTALETGAMFSSVSARATVWREAYMSAPGASGHAEGSMTLASGKTFAQALAAGILPDLAGTKVATGTLRLTDAARGWLAQGKQVFRENCGDAFIYKVVESAEIFGQISVETETTTQKTEVTGALTGSYANVEAEIEAVSKAVDTTESKTMKAEFRRSGGSSTADPTDLESFLRQAAELQQTMEAGKPVISDLVILPYDALAECRTGPSAANCPDAHSSEDPYEAIAYAASNLLSIRDEIVLIKSQPDRYVLDRGAALGRVEGATDLLALYDQAGEDLKRFRDAAAACFDGKEGDCVAPQAANGKPFDPYAYWIKMPAAYEAYPRQSEFELSDAALRKVIARQRLERPSQVRRCRAMPDALGCLTQAQIAANAKSIPVNFNSRIALCKEAKCKAYHYKNQNTGKCLDVKAGKQSDGTRVITYACRSKNAGNQVFTGINTSHQLSAYAKEKGKRKCVKHSGTGTKTTIAISACNNAAGEKWVLTTAGQLRAVGYCLDAKLRLEPCKAGQDTQHWKRY